MTRSRTVVLAAAFVGTAMAAHAGPCTNLIADLKRYNGRLASGQASGPTTAQSVRAQLHHKPTPQSVQRAVKQSVHIRFSITVQMKRRGSQSWVTSALHVSKSERTNAIY